MEFTSSGGAAEMTLKAGNVGIGTSSPFGELSIKSASPQIYLETVSSGNVQINFNENADQLDVMVNNSSGKIAFGTNSTERMRIDSSGNLLVGTTTSSLYNQSSTEGVAIHDDHIQIARSSNICFIPNRYGTDGDIIQFRKDGSTVGKIGNSGTNLYIADNLETGLRFDGSGTDNILPCNSSGGLRDNAIDLGTGSVRDSTISLQPMELSKLLTEMKNKIQQN